jgi:hypothetical protein
MKRAAAVLVLFALGVAPGCNRRALGKGEARLSGSGQVEVAAPNEGWHDVGDGATIHRGDRVRVRQGSVRLQLSEDRSIELRRGSFVEFGAVPKLLAGDALASTSGAPLHVSVAGTEARIDDGAARIQRGLAVVVASYAGDASVDSAGRTLRVPALRQAVVTAAGLIPDRALPLSYDALDSWDRRYLGDAIDLGAELVTRSRGFTAQLAPGEGRSAGFYRQLLPALEREADFGPAMLDQAHSPGEVLVGAAIATEGRRGRFVERWAQVFQFRDEGAAWGLVALDQQVNRSPLLTGVDSAIGRARTPFEAAPAAPPAPPSPAAPEPAAAAAGSATQPTRPSTPATTPTTAPPSDPATPPGTAVTPLPDAPVEPGVLDNTLSGLLDAVNGVLGGRR